MNSGNLRQQAAAATTPACRNLGVQARKHAGVQTNPDIIGKAPLCLHPQYNKQAPQKPETRKETNMCTKRLLFHVGWLVCVWVFTNTVGLADQYDQYFHGREIIEQYYLWGYFWVPYLPPVDHAWVGKQDDVSPRSLSE
jgi:hypothetical protein